MEPYGTPNSNHRLLDVVLPIVTDCIRPVRQDENHLSTLWEKPKYLLSLSKSIVWSRVSMQLTNQASLNQDLADNLQS